MLAVVFLSPSAAYAHGEQLPAFLFSGVLALLIGIPTIVFWRATSGIKMFMALMLLVSTLVTWWMVATTVWADIGDRLWTYTFAMTAAAVVPVVACLALAGLIGGSRKS